MSTTTRTDCHRPSAIVPNDYEYVACEYTRGDSALNLRVCESERTILRAHQAQTGGHTLHEEGSPCDVCGSPKLIYGLMFHHTPSNVYVRVGEDCAHKLGLGGTGKFNAFLMELTQAHPHPVRGGKQPRIMFGTQAASRPPTFVLFTTGFLDPGYRRFIQRRLREIYGFEGSPIVINMRVRERRQR